MPDLIRGAGTQRSDAFVLSNRTTPGPPLQLIQKLIQKRRSILQKARNVCVRGARREIRITQMNNCRSLLLTITKITIFILTLPLSLNVTK
ncbi:MAG: hypothetical protein ACKVS6_11655 [Planctomycetota bacterium]